MAIPHIPLMGSHLLVLYPPGGGDATKDEPDKAAGSTAEVMEVRCVVVGIHEI